MLSRLPCSETFTSFDILIEYETSYDNSSIEESHAGVGPRDNTQWPRISEKMAPLERSEKIANPIRTEAYKNYASKTSLLSTSKV